MERHGRQAVEWTYHFPLRPGAKVTGRLSLSFPEEKVSEAARRAVTESILYNTRQSLADIASTVKLLCLKYLSDSSWFFENLEKSKLNYSNTISQAERDVDMFFERIEDYWAKDFFQKLGVCFLSEFKSNVRTLRAQIKTMEDCNTIDSEQFRVSLRKYFSTLRSVLRVNSTRFIWDAILLNHEQTLLKTTYFKEQHFYLAKIKKNLHQLSEFSTSLACKSVADLQAALQSRLKKQNCSSVETLNKVLISWVKNLDKQRALCGLPTLENIATQNQTAIDYFERMRILKKKHYKIWNLHLKLSTPSKKVDFLAGGIAAAISATFAFFATYVFIISQSGRADLSFSTMGGVALGIFAVGNVVVYVLKDRLKEFLKVKFAEKISKNNAEGTCSVVIDTDLFTNEERNVDVATVSRSFRWVKEKSNWVFKIEENFEILPDAVLADARIVKQKWIIPLAEIFDGLDDTRDTLKIPTRSGAPVTKKLFKHTVFNYKLHVQVTNKLPGCENQPPDHKNGKIVMMGSKIQSVE